MPPLPMLGTASSCFVPLANESSPFPGALSCPCTRCGAVEVQTPLPFTALHQSVPVLLTRFPSVLSNVLPVRFPLEAATKKTETLPRRSRAAESVALAGLGVSRVSYALLRSWAGVSAPNLRPSWPQTATVDDPLSLQQRRTPDSSPRSKTAVPA